MKTPLLRLMKWYLDQCNGLWEHAFGFVIGSLDNPGVYIKINLRNTAMENVSFEEVKDNYELNDGWLICYIQDQEFNGTGSPDRIDDIISIFLNWVSENANGTERG